MRRLSEIEFEIDTVQREMAKLVIQQSDIDTRLASLDRRRAALESEKAAVNV